MDIDVNELGQMKCKKENELKDNQCCRDYILLTFNLIPR